MKKLKIILASIGTTLLIVGSIVVYAFFRGSKTKEYIETLTKKKEQLKNNKEKRSEIEKDYSAINNIIERNKSVTK